MSEKLFEQIYVISVSEMADVIFYPETDPVKLPRGKVTVGGKGIALCRASCYRRFRCRFRLPPYWSRRRRR